MMIRLITRCKSIQQLPIVGRISCFHLNSREISVEEKLNILENGIFAVNKSKNLGSTETVEIIKNLLASDIPLEVLKVGHGGVLDKTATGVLVLGICNGCKILPQFLHGVKKYEVKGHLGISTTTYNETGEIVDKIPYDHVTKDLLLNSLEQFIGNIKQTPPAYSNLKLHGRRYSDLTREGKVVPMKPRPVKCYSLECTNFEPPYFSLSIKCGGGFYVRSLVHDIGKVVGSCAHVVELHRTQHGVFRDHEALVKDKWNIEDILLSIQAAKKKYRKFLSTAKSKIVKKTEEEKEVHIADDFFNL